MKILLNDYTESYENIIILGYFKMTAENPPVNGFMQLHDMYPLTNEPTCFQSRDTTCIDNILTNQNTKV